MTEQHPTTLLPCPFCGNPDVEMVTTQVCCHGCHAVVNFVTSSTVSYSRRKWNSRSLTTKPDWNEGNTQMWVGPVSQKATDPTDVQFASLAEYEPGSIWAIVDGLLIIPRPSRAPDIIDGTGVYRVPFWRELS